MAKIIKINKDYTKGSGLLKLTVTVGNGQKANVFVKLGNEIIVFGSHISNLIIDKVENCVGKTLFIETNCTDVNPDTNAIPLKIELKDDTQNKVVYDNFDIVTDEKIIDDNGGTLIYEVKITINN